MEFSRALFDEGFMETGIAFPIIRRQCAHPTNRDQGAHSRLDIAPEALEPVARRMSLLH